MVASKVWLEPAEVSNVNQSVNLRRLDGLSDQSQSSS